jgi:hypothetical protein
MPHPLQDYRRIQLEVRREFDAFTKVHCPTCPSPCCVKPARITPTDILLAEAHGWKSRVANAVHSAIEGQSAALTSNVEDLPRETCEHLGPKGCSFPADLRPFGCTTYICPIMHERLDRKKLGRIKRKVKELTQAHERLISALNP